MLGMTSTPGSESDMVSNSASNLSVAALSDPMRPHSSASAIPQNKLGIGNAEGLAHGKVVEQKSPESFGQRTFDDPVAAFTLWLAVATTGLWIFTAFLWRATVSLAADAKISGTEQAERMERSIDAATKAALAMESIAQSGATNSEQIIEGVRLNKRAMRAYIAVVIGEASYQDANTIFEARPSIINKGSTEARNVRWKIAADILPVPVPDDFKYPLPKGYLGGSVIGPQNDGLISAVIDRRVSDGEVAEIKRGGSRALTVWGYVIYKDIFGRTHRTTFSQQLRWIQSGKKRLFRQAPQIIRGYFLSKHNRGD
jgi:hypothetical protein